MIWTGVFDLGGAAGRAHALVGFLPTWKGIGYGVWGIGCWVWDVGLKPVGDGGLGAPIGEEGHGGLVGAGDHELAHAFFAVPRGHGPECPALVSEQGAGKEPGRACDLAYRPPGVQQEEGQEADGADAEAGEAYEGHGRTVYSRRFSVVSWRKKADSEQFKGKREPSFLQSRGAVMLLSLEVRFRINCICLRKPI